MPHVSLITLGVDDLDRATRFYEDLGWRRSSASVTGVVAFLEGGNVALGLFGREALAEDAGLTVGLGTDGPADAKVTTGPAVALAMNVPEPGDVDTVLALAQRSGGRVTKPAERATWGGYSGYFVDPEGHLWEVAHNPGFPLDEDGKVTLPE